MSLYHLPIRLYAVVITYWPEHPHSDEFTWESYYQEEVAGPRGTAWDEPAPEFYWPTPRRIYRSRSAATDKLAEFTRWGAEGYLVECTPTWETIPDANARRARERSMP